MSDLSNPHDKFFKETFSRAEVARDFLTHYLPSEVVAALDLDTLEAQPDSFVDPDLQEQFADLLYRVQLRDGRDAYVYFLLEHKSRPERYAIFQFLRYMVRIWEQDRRAGQPLHPVIPLLVYHGQEEWRAATDFGELFAGEEALRPYWPRFRCELYDLARLDDAEIGGALRLQILLLVMKYIFDPALRRHLADIFALFRDLSEDQPAVEYLRTVLYYIGNAAKHLQREEMVTIIQQVLTDEGSTVMETIADQWIKEGVEQGLQQGLQQGLRQGVAVGVEQGLRAAILDTLLLRFDAAPQEIEERLTAVTNTEQLRDLHRQAVIAETLDDFTDLLPQN